ncbi:MAG: ribonuclease III family protein, partial [Gemmataceae bacterium]
VIVSRKTCADYSLDIGLDKFLIVGKGMQRQGEIPPNMLADVFEALVAAIFLDGGWDAAKAFVLTFIEPEIEAVAQNAVGNNAKSALQQISQREFASTPRYLVLDEQGPEHNRCFKVGVEINGNPYPSAWGRNKKDAEIKAAMNALAYLHAEPIPHPSN